MASSKQRCASCRQVGYFDNMHNGDSACCHCGCISKDHDDVIDYPAKNSSNEAS